MKANTQGLVPQIAAQRGAFALIFVAMFVVTFGFLSLVGATPEPSEAVAETTDAPVATPATQSGDTTNSVSPAASAGSVASPSAQAPVRIMVKEIGLDASVANPTSTNVDVLDRAALGGAVRYPTSAQLGEDGTIVLFGHSSYLPVVRNQAYKTFDDIQDLKKGSIVSVYSGTLEYRYSVVGVELADATRDVVELNPNGKHLTLVTCNSFATKSNRFVVKADFVGAYPLTSR